MTKTFNLINSECQFIQEMINMGITQIRNADFQRKGLYYQSFTSLSVGLERLLKLIIILDKYNDTNTFHTQSQLRRSFGHNIKVLYLKCVDVGDRYDVNKMYSESDEIYNNIIDILSEFADVGNDNRYYNLNYISEVETNGFVLPKDTMCKWYEKVDEYIFNNKISDKKKIEIEERSKSMGNLLNLGARIHYTSENNVSINDGVSFCLNKNRQLACQKYRVLFIAQIIRYLSSILNKLGDALWQKSNDNIPYFYDYFRVYRCDDISLKNKKRFIE